MLRFELKKRDALGRICYLYTSHGRIKTPALLPVINPNKIIISPREMKQLFDINIVITNSYIIKKTDKLRDTALDKGLHHLLDYNGVIMTDSGTFQSYVYGDIDVDPLDIVSFQRDIGSDIGTILDVFGTPSQTKSQAKKSVDETIVRAKESIPLKGDMLLACTIQGSIYPDVRRYCARKMSKLDADIYPIGGVVPLMENQRYLDLIRIIIASKMNLPPGKPIHLFGAGHPLIFPIAAALGCDLFDSASYIKYAHEDRYMVPWGTLYLKDIEELPCNCPICSNTSASEFKKLEKKERIKLLAKHNLYVCIGEIKQIRNAIAEGTLWELVERKASMNPFLLEAMRELRRKKIKEWLERFEVTSKLRALFYTGEHTIHQPIIYRIHHRLLERYHPISKKVIVFPEAEKPYNITYRDDIEKLFKQHGEVEFIVSSSIGPIPISLDEMYPFAQSIFPEQCDYETRRVAKQILSRFLKGKQVIDARENIDSKGSKLDYTKGELEDKLDIWRITAVAEIQFGKNASAALFDGELEIVKSKNTGKIRNIYCDGEHILSFRASDGLYTLKKAGGKRLHRFFPSPKQRVIIKDEAIPFVLDGKSVFTRFVEDCDPELRPMDECLIVNRKDELLAIGRCLLNREEMLSFNYGQAVKIRETFRDNRQNT
ncbi:MAG: tRNA guanosine(15) transglycosylase TgtA [Thermoplasmata archaeon]|nr:MAG: tRNA guanosine(15) transglycosylase TgtA [Thermoplasmata archaeon]